MKNADQLEHSGEPAKLHTVKIAEPGSRPNPSANAPRIALMGWCDRAARIETHHPALAHTNIQGLTYSRVSHIFPLNMRGITLVLAIYNPEPGESFTVQFRHSDGARAFDLTMNLNVAQVFDQEQKKYVEAKKGEESGWHIIATQVGTDVLVMRPDILKAYLLSADGEQFLAFFNLVHASIPLYSSDQVAALRSDPLARRVIRMRYTCTECGGQLETYCALERNKALDDQGIRWFADLEDRFSCKCGKLAFDLQYIRTGMHGLLSRSLTPDEQAGTDYVRLYEKTKLEEDCRQFKTLLDQSAPEQEVQGFLETHPIFFSRFSATRLMRKPKIMLKYVADFAILNRRKELLLVEIERPGMRLLTKERRTTADLGHAVAQVRDWIREVNDHRAAVLDSHGIELREVAVVRGVVVGGRRPSDDEDARSLRQSFSGDIDFYTYDDLLGDTAEIIRQIANA